MYEKLEFDSGNIAGFSPGQQISEAWIARAEAALDVHFPPPSYLSRLEYYGAAMLGDQSVFTILQLDFDDACGPDIFGRFANSWNPISMPPTIGSWYQPGCVQ
ncbi:hypothetical protein [Tahibacter sp.]|uniref:hypothetical protein n=1 Tax=Tahibacter sp. TaxID=2056211 RepID=UPI0028C3CF4B|nr:hypothetical protein [Tahibacter sp.]